MTFWIILGVALLLLMIIPPKKKSKSKGKTAMPPQQPAPVEVEEKADPFDFYTPVEDEISPQPVDSAPEMPVMPKVTPVVQTVSPTVKPETADEFPGSIYETEISDMHDDKKNAARKIDGKAMVIYSEILKRKF